MGEDKAGERWGNGVGFSGTLKKDTWTTPKGVGWREGGEDAWGRGEHWGENVEGRQLYLNNSNKNQ